MVPTLTECSARGDAGEPQSMLTKLRSSTKDEGSASMLITSDGLVYLSSVFENARIVCSSQLRTSRVSSVNQCAH